MESKREGEGNVAMFLMEEGRRRVGGREGDVSVCFIKKNGRNEMENRKERGEYSVVVNGRKEMKREQKGRIEIDEGGCIGVFFLKIEEKRRNIGKKEGGYKDGKREMENTKDVE